MGNNLSDLGKNNEKRKNPSIRDEINANLNKKQKSENVSQNPPQHSIDRASSAPVQAQPQPHSHAQPQPQLEPPRRIEDFLQGFDDLLKKTPDYNQKLIESSLKHLQSIGLDTDNLNKYIHGKEGAYLNEFQKKSIHEHIVLVKKAQENKL